MFNELNMEKIEKEEIFKNIVKGKINVTNLVTDIGTIFQTYSLIDNKIFYSMPSASYTAELPFKPKLMSKAYKGKITINKVINTYVIQLVEVNNSLNVLYYAITKQKKLKYMLVPIKTSGNIKEIIFADTDTLNTSLYIKYDMREYVYTIDVMNGLSSRLSLLSGYPMFKQFNRVIKKIEDKFNLKSKPIFDYHILDEVNKIDDKLYFTLYDGYYKLFDITNLENIKEVDTTELKLEIKIEKDINKSVLQQTFFNHGILINNSGISRDLSKIELRRKLKAM